MDGWRSKWPLCDPSKKPLFFIEKMLRLLEIFMVKNSSPFFSKLVRVRGPNHYILLIGTIKDKLEDMDISLHLRAAHMGPTLQTLITH